MTLAWSEHPDARAEFLGAATWYEDQEVGLGARFASELSQGIHHIREWPHAAPALRESVQLPLVRRKSVNVFPYRIIYKGYPFNFRGGMGDPGADAELGA